MGPKTPVPEQDFFRHPLREQINLKHPLVRLTDLINWERLGALMVSGEISAHGFLRLDRAAYVHLIDRWTYDAESLRSVEA
jgi:hypothetical protein